MSDEGGGASRSTDPAAGTSSATDVSLREFSRAVRDGDLRFVVTLFIAMLGFGGFAWAQIQRRLEILNHENARVAAVVDQTVSADTYTSDKSRTDDERDKLDLWRAGVDEKFTRAVTRDDLSRETKGDRQTNTGLWLAVAAIVATIVIAAVTIIATRIQPSTPSTVTVTVPAK